MLHLSKKQTQTFLVVARWRHKQKTYRWCKNDHVLSDKNNNAKTNNKKQKGKKPTF